MSYHILFLLCVFASAWGSVGMAADGTSEKAIAEELKRLEGDWKIVAAEQNGEAVESNATVTFSGEKCTIANPGTIIVLENTISIDPSKTPKQIKVTNTKTKKSWVGIYELNGDKLRCVFSGGKAALTEFKTKKGGAEVMYTYERVKTK